MDLRSVLNNADTADRDRERERKTSKAQSTPQQPHRHIQPHPQTQQRSPAGFQYRAEYPAHHQPHQSPGGRPPSQEYPPQYHPSHHPQQQQQQQQQPQQQSQPQQQPPPSAGQYPVPYQTPGHFAGRPAPPPIQAGSFHDARSPGGAPMAAPSPTAYRPTATPNGPPAGGASGYPFPPSHAQHEITSPSMRHQPHPGSYQPHQPQRHDSYPHGPVPYAQPQPAPVPQTPPVGTPGSSHPFIPQRSQSAQSTPTPTSAHSQQFGTPYAHGSPVASTHPIPPNAEYNRQPSQPPTPLGPPASALQRQPSVPVAYSPQQQQAPQPPLSYPPQPQQQPQSPYQKRMSSAPGPHVVQTIQTSPALAHAQKPPHVPVQQQQQQQPLPPPPPPVQRVHESPIAENHIRRPSYNEREHSMSVSPKTRVPSLPSNADRTSFSREIESRQVHSISAEPMVIDTDRATTPAKRKLADRDLSPRELERKESRPPPGEMNGGISPEKKPSTRVASEATDADSLPPKPRNAREPRREEPVWAKNAHILGKQLPSHPNYVLQKRVHSHLNGGKPDGIQTKSRSRPDSPEAVKVQPKRISQAGPPAIPEPDPRDLLGPWDATITGLKPYEEASKKIADFLFHNVVNNPDMQEIASRGIKFEIEAKLGTLIDKDTNHRVDRHLASEAVLEIGARTAFKSSMTEIHHKAFNDFLNKLVLETDPRNPTAGGKRVQIDYKHRREIDRFFELPPDLQVRLPGVMRHLLGRKNIRVRVTYDQKTNEVLGKIVKARIADIDLHLPACHMDCRLSINLEMDWEGSVEELEQAVASRGGERQPDRNKDRLSYKQGHYQIDLTQVTQQHNGLGGTRTDKEHELEIELSPDILIDQGRRALGGAPHRYSELVEGLVDNVRVLARKANEF